MNLIIENLSDADAKALIPQIEAILPSGAVITVGPVAPTQSLEDEVREALLVAAKTGLTTATAEIKMLAASDWAAYVETSVDAFRAASSPCVELCTAPTTA